MCFWVVEPYTQMLLVYVVEEKAFYRMAIGEIMPVISRALRIYNLKRKKNDNIAMPCYSTNATLSTMVYVIYYIVFTSQPI